jgi:hypothetical protein
MPISHEDKMNKEELRERSGLTEESREKAQKKTPP